MNTRFAVIKALGVLLIFAAVAISGAGCKRNCTGSAMGCRLRTIISFKDVEGIDYTEVYRRMKNGLSFNYYGYQLEPQWKLRFVSEDSARIFSPVKNKFINFPLTRGYDSIFNTARTWYRMKKMNKDSLVLEIMKFKSDTIDLTGNKVYMTFYSNNYIYHVLHTDSATLRRPSRKDTLYVRSLVNKVNANPDSCFAARQPVTLKSKSPQITVEQRKTAPDMLNNFDSSDDYLDPEFYITIHKAYQDFAYSFTVIVGPNGEMRYGVPLVPFTDDSFKQSYIHLSQAVMNTYLKYYLQVTPGSTLGMPHNSMISVHVTGVH